VFSLRGNFIGECEDAVAGEVATAAAAAAAAANDDDDLPLSKWVQKLVVILWYNMTMTRVQ
jgi:hypothetical protein